MSGEGGVVALTFDDGPDPRWTRRILDVLGGTRGQATFFVIGERCRGAGDVVMEIVGSGHEVGLHCMKHIRHDEMTRRQIAEDAARGLDTLDTLGLIPAAWRPPWGIVTEATFEVAEDFDLELAGWTIDTRDWKGEDADTMAAAVGRPVDGDVILMHDALGPGALRSGCEETVTLVSRLVGELEAQDMVLGGLAETGPAAAVLLQRSGLEERG